MEQLEHKIPYPTDSLGKKSYRGEGQSGWVINRHSCVSWGMSHLVQPQFAHVWEGDDCVV